MTYCKVGSHTNAAATLAYGRYKNGKKRENIVINAINCSPKTAKEEFALVRNLYGKNDGVQIHTIIQSFSDEDNLSMEEVNAIGIETAKRICPGHQAVVITHQDGVGGKKHNHIMFNSVKFETGQKFNNHALLYKAREISDEICEERGLKTIPHDNPTKFEEKLKSRGEKPWKDKLREILNEAKSIAKNLDEFKEIIKSEGIEINERNSRKEGGKAWTYIIERNDWQTKAKITKIRGRTLGDDFTYAKIRQCVNKPKVIQSEEVKPTTSTSKQNSMPQNDYVSAIKMIAKKDFAGAAQKFFADTSNNADDKAQIFMRYVVSCHGTDDKALFDAVDAVTNCKGETPIFTGQLLQGTLKTDEYQQSFNHGGKGILSGILDKISGKDDKWASLVLTKKPEEIGDWNTLSEAEKAEIRANLDNIDRY